MVGISPNQLKLIRDTWVHVTPALMEHGVNIFYEFFKKFPDNLKYFPKFTGVELEKIKSNPAVHVHGMSVASMFEKTIKIYDLEGGEAEAVRIWTELGESHKVRKLKRESFVQLREVILDYLVKTLKLNGEQKAAYEAMMEFAYEHFLASQSI
uniref:CSON006202 protein n=1 Tax=Culicoides sonorensis TaxID=179676 RepID=A0A336LW00_CULSO